MPKHRLQFDFDESAYAQINDLLEATGIKNRAELVRNALAFLRHMHNEAQQGSEILIQRKDGKVRQIVWPFWLRSTKDQD